MSDGPHKSLPLGRAWKRVAERADNDAFSAEEISSALIPALEKDCRADINAAFLRDMRSALEERDSLLFKIEINSVTEGLRADATSSMERAIFDNVRALSAEDLAGADLLLRAVEAVVSDRAARGARQVEEHYLRRSTAERVSHLRDRMEVAITTMDAGEVAAKLLNVGQRESQRTPAKRRGLDDGVDLP